MLSVLLMTLLISLHQDSHNHHHQQQQHHPGPSPSAEDIIIHSETPSKAQQGYKQRVSLLETDLTNKNCSVIINDIGENDTGDYQFRLLSAYTYINKVKITVKALTQKPSVLTPPLTEGEPATMTCTSPGICSGSPPKITWTWRGTGDNITEEDLTNVTTTHFSTLTFTPSAEHHNMMVTCQVTFHKTSKIEETVTLNVSYPQITGNKMVKEDGTLDLTCSVDSFPPSDITWSKNGTLQNYTENATLTISNVTREHAGEYVCTVQHLNRTITASTVVTVILLVGNYNNITVECVSRNVVGVVREKLQVAQNKSQEKQKGNYISQGTWLESHSFPIPPNVCNIENVLYI
uniref:B-cell receptor CD22 n=1 Tax=Hucho hucho TaxID=62062 RepID=A0A4W5NU44_9TELE